MSGCSCAGGPAKKDCGCAGCRAGQKSGAAVGQIVDWRRPRQGADWRRTEQREQRRQEQRREQRRWWWDQRRGRWVPRTFYVGIEAPGSFETPEGAGRAAAGIVSLVLLGTAVVLLSIGATKIA